MKANERLMRLMSILMLVVFANFYCGNSMFMHSHTLNGHTIVHSHPMLPGSQHSHSASQIQIISLSNLMVQSMDQTSEPDVFFAPYRCQTRIIVPEPFVGHIELLRQSALRAPPVRA